MKNIYKPNHWLFLFFTFAISVAFSRKLVAQTYTFVVPSADSTNVYSGSTTIGCYTKPYEWICPNSYLHLDGGCGGANDPYPMEGIFLVEEGGTIDLRGAGGSFTAYLKANATYIGGGGGSNIIYADPTATISDPGTTVIYGTILFNYSNAPVNGCVPIAPPPVALFGANTMQVCAGSPVTFADSSTGSPTSWKWTFSGGTPDTSSIQNPTVSYDTAGIFNVTLVASNSSGADTLVKTGYIHVTALPVLGQLSANPDTLCAGDSSSITISGSTGSIQWQSSATPGNYQNIANANSAVYNTPLLSQNIYYRAVLTSGICADTSAPLMLTVHPLPSPPTLLTPDSLICSSDSATITATGGYATYRWNDGDTIGYTIVKAAGGYWVTVTDANHCQAVSGHQEISVYPVPSVSITVQGDTLSSYGATAYQWYLNSDSIPNANSPSYIATKSGEYAVEITDTNGCKALSGNTNLTITGINNLIEDEGILLFPNPSVGNCQLVVGNNLVGSALEVYNDEGRIVFQSEIRNPKSEIELNVAKGIYWLRILNTRVNVVKKLVRL